MDQETDETSGGPREAKPSSVGLPIRPFLYTLDQIAHLMSVESERYFINANRVHFEGRSQGTPRRDQMLARNISPGSKAPDWRIAEQEFIRYLKYHNFKVYVRSWLVK